MTAAHPKTVRLERVDDGTGMPQATLVNVCRMCGKTHRLEHVFTLKKWEEWLSVYALGGVRVHNFWPELTPAEREEFLLSGTCDACWRQRFVPPPEVDA